MSTNSKDLICSICQAIFVEPVTLPCGHSFCRACFDGILKYNTLTCPCCRQRFGNWLRRATRPGGNLINRKLWEFIQKNCEKENFEPSSSILAATTVAGKKDSPPAATTTITTTQTTISQTAATTVVVTADPFPTKLSEPGEIQKEFQEQLEQFRQELEITRQNELKATQELIIKLFKEELEATNSKSQKSNLIESSTDMLVANLGHTPYALASTSGTSKKQTNNCKSSETKRNHVSAAVISVPSTSVASCHQTTGNHSLSNSIAIPSTSKSTLSSLSSTATTNSNLIAHSSKCNLMKTLAVRLNRDTEFLKHTPSKQNNLKSSSTSQLSLTSSRCKRLVLTVPPTKIHRAPSRNTNSTDSLSSEMCHFKPIRTVPTTPTRRNGTDHESMVQTPKPRKFPIDRTNVVATDENITRNRSSRLQQELLKASRKSAFTLVDFTKSQREDKTSQNATESSHCFTNIQTIRKSKSDPIVRLRRCRIQNRSIISTDAIHQSQRSQLAKNSGTAKTKFEFVASLNVNRELAENLIMKQERCEKLIRQEQKDFELAKKLQSELEKARPRAAAATVERTIPCTRRRLRLQGQMNGNAIEKEGEIIDLADSIPTAAKRCRRQCGEILSAAGKKSKSSKRVVNDKTELKTKDSTTPRRSKRIAQKLLH